MKCILVVLLFAGYVAASNDVCHADIIDKCRNTDDELNVVPQCDARYGGIDYVEKYVQKYVNLALSKSHHYLLLSSYFNNYKKNRPGFEKLYKGLSDKAFDDTIDLIKQLARRGGKIDFTAVHEDTLTAASADFNELESLGVAVDNEKVLAKRAFEIHNHATHSKHHDPEMAHYFEEKYFGQQAENIRKLTGYANDLSKLLKGRKKDVDDIASVGFYLFDQYLEKQ